jgi:hypothetical protein
MPFGYEAAQKAFSGGLQGLTSSVSQMLMAEYMRKQKEEEAIRTEQRDWQRRQKELDIALKNNKDLAKFKTTLDAELDANKGDPYLRALNKRVRSGEATPEEQAIHDNVFEMFEHQSRLEPLTEEQLDFIDQIRPQFPTIAIGLYDQELKRAEFAKEIEVDLERIDALYGGRARTAERTYRQKESDKVKKNLENIDKQIFSVKEKLLKEETEAEKWYRKENEPRVQLGKEKERREEKETITSKRKLRKYDIPIEEPRELRGETPPNAEKIKLYRKQLKDLERKHEIALEAIERRVGVSHEKEAEPVEEILREIREKGIPDEVREAMEKKNLTLEEALEKYIKYRLEEREK